MLIAGRHLNCYPALRRRAELAAAIGNQAPLNDECPPLFLPVIITVSSLS